MKKITDKQIVKSGWKKKCRLMKMIINKKAICKEDINR